jgi:hypothetical protein
VRRQCECGRRGAFSNRHFRNLVGKRAGNLVEISRPFCAVRRLLSAALF